VIVLPTYAVWKSDQYSTFQRKVGNATCVYSLRHENLKILLSLGSWCPGQDQTMRL